MVLIWCSIPTSSSFAEPVPLTFQTKTAGFVSLSLYHPDGSLVCPILTGTRMSAGNHVVHWNGESDGTPLPPGEYVWKAAMHDGISMELRGWVADWGGNQGVPSAVATDDSLVYLGWTKTTPAGCSVLACTPEGKVRWCHYRGKLSGCHSLSVDAGMVYVLGGEGDDAEGGAIYRLSDKDGSIIPWPDGRIDLKIASLWPADGKPKPCLADYFAVKNGHIYLSFTKDEFAAVLDAKNGAYLQTLVGAPPGPIDSVATKSDTPEKPNELVDADFVVTALKGGTIGKILLIHDPIWVVGSDLNPLNRNERITAIAMLGDGAKFHRHDIFIGLGFPFNQIQARSALATEGFTFLAGKPGGRLPHGPWQPDRLGIIRALALDGTGQLWVAEGSSAPKRISVWSSSSAQGQLKAEYFGPADSQSPVAINPADPNILFADGCEWRIDPATGRAKCQGIVTPDPIQAARYALDANSRILLVLTPLSGGDLVYERNGDGDYQLLNAPAPQPIQPQFEFSKAPSGQWNLLTKDGLVLGQPFEPVKGSPKARNLVPSPGNDWPLSTEKVGVPTLTTSTGGKTFLTAGTARIWCFELMGLNSIRPLTSGTFTLR